jgi:acetyl esterase
MEWFWDAHLPAGKRNDLYVPPLNPALEKLKGVSPALLVTDENDALREEGETYGRKLMQRGALVTSTRDNGMIHGFAMRNALADAPDAKSAKAATPSMLGIFSP